MGLQRARLGETPRRPLLHPTGNAQTVGLPQGGPRKETEQESGERVGGTRPLGAAQPLRLDLVGSRLHLQPSLCQGDSRTSGTDVQERTLHPTRETLAGGWEADSPSWASVASCLRPGHSQRPCRGLSIRGPEGRGQCSVHTEHPPGGGYHLHFGNVLRGPL